MNKCLKPNSFEEMKPCWLARKVWFYFEPYLLGSELSELWTTSELDIGFGFRFFVIGYCMWLSYSFEAQPVLNAILVVFNPLKNTSQSTTPLVFPSSATQAAQSTNHPQYWGEIKHIQNYQLGNLYKSLVNHGTWQSLFWVPPANSVGGEKRDCSKKISTLQINPMRADHPWHRTPRKMATFEGKILRGKPNILGPPFLDILKMIYAT